MMIDMVGTIRSHYRIVEKLGQGGMGVVFNRAWTPDGKYFTFSMNNSKWSQEFMRQIADGSAPPELLAEQFNPSVWVSDNEVIGLKNRDFSALKFAGSKKEMRLILPIPENLEAAWPSLSPGGRWLAYGSNESGQYEVYIQPYPGSGGRRPVSINGGDSPVWNRRGGELFYITLPDKEGLRRMMSVAIPDDPGAQPGTPKPLFSFKDSDLRFGGGNPIASYDVSRDGLSFYATQVIPTPLQPPVTHVHIILNWLEELKAKVAGGK